MPRDSYKVFPIVLTVIIALSCGGAPTLGPHPNQATTASRAPVVSSFSPGSGTTGATVTVTGSGFTGATSVDFNAVAATFTVVSDTQLTAVVPAGLSTGLISVTTSGGTGVSSSAFTVLVPPQIASFTPTTGTFGVSVTIKGSGFTGATAVNFNGTPGSSFTVVSDTQITDTVPAGATSGPISITTPDGTGTSSISFGMTSNIRYYAANSFWNPPIPASPGIDPNSSNIVSASILPYQATAQLLNTDAWGISVATATPASTIYTVLCTLYGCGDTVTFPIPNGALPSTGSDQHLVVINPATNQELDMWMASFDSSTNTWSAGSRVVNDLYGWGACGPPGTHCFSMVAAGFAGMGGVVRPEEIQQGHIDHALSITLPYTQASSIACPATHTDGVYSDPNAIPEGARIQLDPSFNVDAQSWPPWEKVIAKALQTYGAYITDTGGTLAIYAQTSMNTGNLSWSSVGVPDAGPSLADLPWPSFRVLTITSCN